MALFSKLPYGVSMAFLSMVLMCSFAVVTKVLQVSTSLTLLMTGIAFFGMGFILHRPGTPHFSFNKTIALICITEGIDFIGRVSMVQFLPISLALAINCSTPVYGAIIESFVSPGRYSLRMKGLRWLCICSCVTCVAFQSLWTGNSDGKSVSLLGIFLAFASAVARVMFNFVAETKDEEASHENEMFNAMGLLYVVLAVPFFIFGSREGNFSSAAVNGVVYSLATWSVIHTFDKGDITVTNALALRTLTIPLGFALGVTLLGEFFSWRLAAASTGITSSALFLVLCLDVPLEEQPPTGEEAKFLPTPRQRQGSRLSSFLSNINVDDKITNEVKTMYRESVLQPEPGLARQSCKQNRSSLFARKRSCDKSGAPRQSLFARALLPPEELAALHAEAGPHFTDDEL